MPPSARSGATARRRAKRSRGRLTSASLAGPASRPAEGEAPVALEEDLRGAGTAVVGHRHRGGIGTRVRDRDEVAAAERRQVVDVERVRALAHGPVDASAPRSVARVDGPICESTDTLDRHELPALRRGDLVAIADAGAYAASMAMTYNGRRRPPQVLLEPDGSLALGRRRG